KTGRPRRGPSDRRGIDRRQHASISSNRSITSAAAKPSASRAIDRRHHLSISGIPIPTASAPPEPDPGRTPLPPPDEQAKKSPAEAGLEIRSADASDDRLHACRLRTLRTLGDFVLDALSFLQATETLRVNRRIMDE